MNDNKILFFLFIALIFLCGCSNKTISLNIVSIDDLDSKCKYKESRKSSRLDRYEMHYYQQLHKIIQDQWALPDRLIKQGLESTVVMQIDSSGNVEKISYEKKSGNDDYDYYVLRAVRNSLPFPEIPQQMGQSCLQLGIKFTSGNLHK